MSTNGRMPVAAARYRTARPRNARFFFMDAHPLSGLTGVVSLWGRAVAPGLPRVRLTRGLGGSGRGCDRLVEFATLRGDASDGLPGVKGVGEKTASGLLQKYGDLPGIVAAAADPDSTMAPGPRLKIKDAASYLEVAPKVVAVARDIDLPRGDALLLPCSPADPDVLDALTERWSLGSAVERLTHQAARGEIAGARGRRPSAVQHSELNERGQVVTDGPPFGYPPVHEPIGERNVPDAGPRARIEAA